MQKFGLGAHLDRSNRYSKLNKLQKEFLKEQSTALGRAGKNLKKSIDYYRRHEIQFSDEERVLRHQEIADHLHNLLLQRELVGFIDANIEWIRESFDIPERCYELLGHGKTPGSDM